MLSGTRFMSKDVEFWFHARQRIFRLARIDSSHKLVFGSNLHKYEIFHPVPEERICAFETENCVQLPPEFRSFLTTFGAGGAGPDYGVFNFFEIDAANVRMPFHLTETTSWPDDDDDPMWELPGLLTIATSGCAIDWSIEINGPQPGTMWVNAGPGDSLMRCDTFGTWYEKWLDRVELGLQKHELVSGLIASGATIDEITGRCGVEPEKFDWDGVAYLRFPGIPGRIRADGNRVASFDIGTCWIM